MKRLITAAATTLLALTGVALSTSPATADDAHRAIVDKGTVGCQDGFGNVTQDTKRTATSSGSVKFICHYRETNFAPDVKINDRIEDGCLVTDPFIPGIVFLDLHRVVSNGKELMTCQ